MNIQFGKVEYIYAKTRRREIPKNEDHFKQLDAAVEQRITMIDESEKLAFGVFPPLYLNSGAVCCGDEKTSKSKGYLGKVVTGPDAQKMLETMGLKVNLSEPKDVIEKKLFDDVRKRYKKPNMTHEEILQILCQAVENYTALHELAKKPINRIYLKV